MNPKLQNKLFNDYPLLFQNRHKSMKETCMCWGIESDGNGWYEILDNLCYSLSNYQSCYYHLDKNGKYVPVYPPKITFGQIKEKFGTLTIYYDLKYNVNPEDFENPDKVKDSLKTLCNYIDGMISAAEILSERTCENCGSKEGYQNKDGWIKTLCAECRK